jgi:hypothetical protein
MNAGSMNGIWLVPYRRAKTFTDKLMPSVLAKVFREDLIEQGKEGIQHG